MPEPIVGLHHVTAIASDPQRNLDFYTELIGLRFVKRTINFDDPSSYHFYFGDDIGSPGTILTFFPWPDATRGSMGIGESSAIAFSIAPASLDFWEARLLKAGVPAERVDMRFGDAVLSFADPDGVRRELIGHANLTAGRVPRASDVPAKHSIRGFFGVTLCEACFEMTAAVLGKMGFTLVGEEANRYRFSAPGPALGNHIDIRVQPQLTYGRMGAGSVHHIAFRAPDAAAQCLWREELKAFPLNVTPVLDRTYFHSIYFREPGGCCSRSQQTRRALPSMNRPRHLEKLSNYLRGLSRSAILLRRRCYLSPCTTKGRSDVLPPERSARSGQCSQRRLPVTRGVRGDDPAPWPRRVSR